MKLTHAIRKSLGDEAADDFEILLNENLLTKQEFNEKILNLELSVNEKIANLELSVNEKIANLEFSVNEKIANQELSINEKIAVMREDFAKELGRTNEKIAQSVRSILLWMLGILIPMWASMVFLIIRFR